jgi:hypothetical protein
MSDMASSLPGQVPPSAPQLSPIVLRFLARANDYGGQVPRAEIAADFGWTLAVLTMD